MVIKLLVRSAIAISIVLSRTGAVFLTVVPQTHADEVAEALRAIPAVSPSPKRPITADDLLRLRDIDSLSVSADCTHFAILVRQAVPERNTYRTGWFVGSTAGGELTFVGDGGDAGPMTLMNGTTGGEIAGEPGHWSPDGDWLAYTMKRNHEVQVWRSRRRRGGGAVDAQCSRCTRICLEREREDAVLHGGDTP